MLFVLLLGLAPRPLLAESPEEKAALLVFEEGRRQFKTGRYGAALKSFQQADALLQRNPIRYYLGRTYAALGRCAKAVPILAALEGKLPPKDEEGRDLEKLRATDEIRCRLALSMGSLKDFRCREVLAQLTPVGESPYFGAQKGLVESILRKAAACVRQFDTSDEAGRRAARHHALGRISLANKAYDRALAEADRSLAARPSDPAAFVRGVALAHLGKCEAALTVLGKVEGRIEPADEAVRLAAETDCLVSYATTLIRADRCREAQPLLLRLRGRLRGTKEAWRLRQERHCAPRATEFLTDTPARKAAYTLFLAARARRARGGLKRAADLYQKALRTIDEPVIRRELAETQIRRNDYRSAGLAIAGIPKERQTPADRWLAEICLTYRPTGHHGSNWNLAYIRQVSRGLEARDEDDLQAMVGRLAMPQSGRNEALWALRANAFFEIGACAEYLALLEASPARAEHLRDVAIRKRACKAGAIGRAREHLASMQTAYEHHPTSWLRVQVGRAFVLVGQYPEAASAFRAASASSPLKSVVHLLAIRELKRIRVQLNTAWLQLPEAAAGRSWVLDSELMPVPRSQRVKLPAGRHVVGWMTAGGVFEIHEVLAVPGKLARVSIVAGGQKATRIHLSPPRAEHGQLMIGDKRIALPGKTRLIRAMLRLTEPLVLLDAQGAQIGHRSEGVQPGEEVTWEWWEPEELIAGKENTGFPWAWVWIGGGVAVAAGIVTAVVLTSRGAGGPPDPTPNGILKF